MVTGELLSPAGDRESFLAALDGGANAIYVGLTAFSARKNATNFTADELRPLIYRAHIFGVKVYIAANTLVKDGETEAFLRRLRAAEECGADALILQDIHLADAVRKTVGLPLHLSTQAGVCNVWGAMEAKRKGFSRVILARETKLKDIEAIAKIIETETFIQGALCSSLSGHCLMSSFAGCNSANRGLCKQPCRKSYRLEGEEGYLISLADLSVGKRIEELAAAGVRSFKIEGRMRSPAYVYAATAYYRALMDGEKGDFSALKRAYNRGDYTEGYAFGEKKVRYALENGHIGESVGKVCRVTREESLVKSKYRPKEGDGFKVLHNGKEAGGTSRWRTDGAGGFYLKGAFCVGDDVRLTATAPQYQPRVIKVSAKGVFRAGENARVTLTANGVCVDTEGAAVQPARNAPMTADGLKVLFGKTGELPFVLDHSEWDADGGFLTAKECNEWRRNAYRKLADALVARTEHSRAAQNCEAELERTATPYLDMHDCRKITVAEGAGDGELRVVFPKDYRDESAVANAAKKGKERYVLLYVPAFFGGEDEKLIEKLLPHFDGIYANGRGAADFARANGVAWIAGLGMGAFCKQDVAALYADGASAVVLSNELSEGETKAVLKEFPQVFVHTAGGIRLMEFMYCPYGGDCAKCKGKNGAILTDDGGRQFYLRRYRMSDCRFELYNGAKLSVPFGGNCLEEKMGAEMVSGGVTKGHWKRPLPSATDGND